MLAKFIKFAGLSLVIAFIISMGASYLIQTNNTNSLKTEEMNILLDDVRTLIDDNYEELAEIRTQMDKEYLEKTRAFAEMIKINPEILDDYDLLCQIRDDLGVDELHVCDENGVLLWGSVK